MCFFLYNLLPLFPLFFFQCIYGCYVHSAILPTFHRRCYWLLQVLLPTQIIVQGFLFYRIICIRFFFYFIRIASLCFLPFNCMHECVYVCVCPCMFSDHLHFGFFSSVDVISFIYSNLVFLFLDQHTQREIFIRIRILFWFII